MKARKQAGFFDAGLSAVVLAVAGIFIWTVESGASNEVTVARQQQVEQAELRIEDSYAGDEVAR